MHASTDELSSLFNALDLDPYPRPPRRSVDWSIVLAVVLNATVWLTILVLTTRALD